MASRCESLSGEKVCEHNDLEIPSWGNAKIGCILTGIVHSDADQRKISPY